MRISKSRTNSRLSKQTLGGLPQQIVEINSEQFVSNLYWLMLSSATQYMSEARKEGDRNGCDIVAIRRGRRIQAGFVARKAGVVKGMYSMAASLAALLGESWCGAFALRDGRYVVVVVNQGQIAPGYDLITDAEDAVRKIREAISVFQFPTSVIYAAPELKLSPHSKDLYELLKPKALRKDLRLKPLRFGLTRREITIAASIVAAIAVAVAGYFLYRHHRDLEAAAENARDAARKQAELIRLNETARKTLMLEALAHPWATQPSMQDFVNICWTAGGALPLSIAGWPLADSTCDATSLVAHYTRGEGLTDNQFIAAAKALGLPTPTFDQTGNIATIAVFHTMPAGGDDALPSAERTTNDFRSHIQAIPVTGLTPNVTEKPVVLSFPTGPNLPQPDPSLKPPEATWRQFTVTLNGSKLPPDQLMQDYADARGVRIESIKTKLDASASELTWDIEGNLYAQR